MSLPMPPSRRGRRHRATVVVALLLALPAAAVALLTAVRPQPGTAPGQSPPPPKRDVRVPSPAAGPGSPAAAPPAGWRAVTVDGAAVPVSPGDGPARTAGQLAAGFADTPAGAVLAAVNTAVRVSGQLGPVIFGPTITAQVTGSGTRALLNAAWADYAQASTGSRPRRPGGPAGPVTAEVTAFKIDSWTRAAATVTVTAAADGTARAQVAVRLQLRWLSGDWRLVAPPGGAFPAAAASAGIPPGFTPLPAGGTT
jgi:hypothetical protein